MKGFGSSDGAPQRGNLGNLALDTKASQAPSSVIRRCRPPLPAVFWRCPGASPVKSLLSM